METADFTPQPNPLAGLKIGFIGLGNMGRPMTRHLKAAGAEVICWNRSPEPLEAAEALGMRRANSLADLAREVGASKGGGVVCLNLTTTEVVAEIVFGENGLHAGPLDPSTLIIDFGTTGVPETKDVFSKRHSAWIDAPVSGGQVGAERAELTVMAGGSVENFDRALPVLRTVGTRVTHMGPSGAGQVTKLANQLIVAQTIDAVAQALRLAELSGVDSGLVRQALMGGFAESRILNLHGERMVKRNFTPGGRAALQLKDVRMIHSLAESVGFTSPTLDNCKSQWERMVNEEGLGEADHSGLFMLYEKAPK